MFALLPDRASRGLTETPVLAAVLVALLLAAGGCSQPLVTERTDINGEVIYENGRLSPKCIYRARGIRNKEGQREGEWTFWWDSGGIRERGSYERAKSQGYAGTLVKSGLWRQWNRDGTLVGHCEFQPVLEAPLPGSGSPFGSIAKLESLPTMGFRGVFDDDGKLLSIKIYFSTLRLNNILDASQDPLQPIHTIEPGDTDNLSETTEQLRDRFRMFQAAKSGDLEKAQQLLDEDAFLAGFAFYHDVTALHIATLHEQADVVRLLIENGAKADAKTDSGLASLHIIARKGYIHEPGYEEARLSVVEALINGRADPDVKDSVGNSPLHYAVQSGGKKLAGLLIAKGGDVNATNREMETPLHVASRNHQATTVGLLISKGADMDAVDVKGRTPLHCALEAAGLGVGDDTARYLIVKGASVGIRDKQGVTPMMLAKQHHLAGIIRLLVKHGARK